MPGEQADGLTDRTLLARCAAGDRDACGAFLARHLDAVHRFARAVAGDDGTAEDAVQDTFLAALRAAGTFQGEAGARAWLLTIARNAVHRLHRRRAGEPVRFEPLDALGAAAGWGAEDGPEAALLGAERRAAFAAALDALSPDDRAVLTLRDLEGLSGEETAAVLGVPLATAKTRLHRARLRFAAALRSGGPHGA